MLPYRHVARPQLVGGCPELGSWDAHKAPNMKWSEGDVWVSQTQLKPGVYEFKVSSTACGHSRRPDEQEAQRYMPSYRTQRDRRATAAWDAPAGGDLHPGRPSRAVGGLPEPPAGGACWRRPVTSAFTFGPSSLPRRTCATAATKRASEALGCTR